MLIKEQIKAYISKKNADHAIMITGKWGCGKTYFIENIENSSSQKFIYYSLNGAINLSDVISSVFFDIISVEKYKKQIKQGIKITSIIGDAFKEKNDIAKIVLNAETSIIDYSLKRLGNNIKNGKNEIIVILDDLERISDTIDITDLFGIIHTKFILNGIKVIYIADDEHIKDKEKFDKEKEKYIQRIWSFITDKNDVFSSFLDDYEINTQNFIQTLHKVFDEQQINLRTVKFCLECYNEINQFCKTLSLDEYNSSESLFYSICQIGKFYRDGNSDKEMLKEELHSYYIKNHYGNNSNKQKSNYEIFAEIHGSEIIKEGFIFDLIFDGIFLENQLKFYLQKPEYNQDPLFSLTDVLQMETSELVETLQKVKENLKEEKYSIMQYRFLRNNYLPNALKVNLDTEESILQMISISIFSKKNKKDLENMFEHWLEDSFSRIQKPENVFEIQLVDSFNGYCEKIDDKKTEEFYQCLVNCDRKIYKYKSNYSIFTLLVRRNCLDRILALPNKSLRYFIYFIDTSICRLTNAYDFYIPELTSLEEIKLKCEEIQKSIDKNDILRINTIHDLRITVEKAMEQIRKKDE